MSNWLIKSSLSMEASKVLCEQFANQSVHCAYYSCVQYLYHVLNTEMGETENDLNTGKTKGRFENSVSKNGKVVKQSLGTHVWLQKELHRSLRSRGINPNHIDQINRNITTMCEVRIIADYRSEIILKPQAAGIVEKAEIFIETLENIYK